MMVVSLSLAASHRNGIRNRQRSKQDSGKKSNLSAGFRRDRGGLGQVLYIQPDVLRDDEGQREVLPEQGLRGTEEKSVRPHQVRRERPDRHPEPGNVLRGALPQTAVHTRLAQGPAAPNREGAGPVHRLAFLHRPVLFQL